MDQKRGSRRGTLSTNPPRLLRVTEVAELLGISNRTVWRLVSIGQLPPPVRIGRSARWLAEDIVNAISKVRTRTRRR